MDSAKRDDWRRLAGVFVVAAVLLPLSFSMAQAAWPDDPTVNLPVCVMAQNQTRPAAISDGSGGLIIVWQDYRNLGHDIYAQRIGADGSDLWTANGVPVCAATGEQEFPRVVTDGLGGAIIVWEDRRSGTVDLYAQRINASGVGQWTPNGIVICESPSYENQIQAIPDGLGGAIVSWTDGRNGLPDIYAQRISAAGDTLWTLNGVGVCTDKDDQVESQLAPDVSGGAIVSWVDGRGLRSGLYISRIDASGVSAWTQNGVAVTDTNVSQDQQRMVPDGSGGTIVTWVDRRGGPLDIYGQRIAGGLRVWGANGVPICALVDDADTPRSISDGSGGVIVAWYEYRSGDADIYAQRVNGSGIVQWAPDGVPICDDGGEQIWPYVETDGFGGAVIAWSDYRNPATGPDIYAQRVDPTGTTLWTTDGVAISTATDNQSDPVLVYDGRGGGILAWRDKRADSGDIYAQHVGSNGKLGDLVPVAITAFSARATSGGVELSWAVSSDEPTAGYRIYRRRAGGRDVIAMNSRLLPVEERHYIDRAVSAGEDYIYTLAVVLPDGSEIRSANVAVKTPAGEISLEQNTPNPFNPATEISLVLPKPGHATLAIYDVEGRLVRILTQGPLPEGRSEFHWNAKDGSERPVSSGVYFCRLTVGKTTITRKMILLK